MAFTRLKGILAATVVLISWTSFSFSGLSKVIQKWSEQPHYLKSDTNTMCYKQPSRLICSVQLSKHIRCFESLAGTQEWFHNWHLYEWRSWTQMCTPAWRTVTLSPRRPLRSTLHKHRQQRHHDAFSMGCFNLFYIFHKVSKLLAFKSIQYIKLIGWKRRIRTENSSSLQNFLGGGANP